VTTRRGYRVGSVAFDRAELRDLAVAWLALGLAFTLFLGGVRFPGATVDQVLGLGDLFAASLLTVGAGFLLHELAHKVVAVRFGQVAGFQANYPLLGFAVLSALAGFLFAAPGAVYHRGRLTDRQHGLVAVAGPVTNLGLAAVFLGPVLLLSGTAADVAQLGVLVNLFLAAFNMLPVGPLDGRTVLDWHPVPFAAVLLVSVAAGAAFVWLFGLSLGV